jgi:amino-acid N-acetyltransferase
MNEPPSPLLGQLATQAQFVSWLRDVAPYVHAHRGRTFVVAFGGELVEAGRLNALVHDVSLLHAMGIRLVIVHGSRPQVQAQLALKGIEARFSHGLRITDAAALECAKEASGELRLDIEAAFSQGLPNTPMANSKIRVLSGNFITARPMGIVDGVDFQHTGVVRKVDVDALQFTLANDAIALLSPLGFSPTGEAFNLTLEDTACSVAVALQADKLVLISDVDGVRDRAGALLPELSAPEAEKLIAAGEIAEEVQIELAALLRACRGGVPRAHLLPFALDGALLLELFTHDGVGTMVSTENLEALREAGADDVGGVLKLIEPLEADGTLVKRPRELIEREIDHFTVLEHDGLIFGCAALYPFESAGMGEMACLTVHPDYREYGDGERLLRRIEQRARTLGLKRLFVLTTRTAHWFLKRGFALAAVEDLPVARQQLYNWQRRSQILIKTL